MVKSSDKKTVDLNFRFKERNRSSQDYKAVMLAWYKGLTAFRETLKQLYSKDLISSDLFYKFINKSDLTSLEDNISELRSLQIAPVQAEPTVSSIPTDYLPLVAPRSLSIDELKEKIVDLAKIQNQPDFDFDLLVTATHTLLNHSDITGDEKARYEIYYQELQEYKEYVNLERVKTAQAQHQLQVQAIPRSRAQFQPQTQYQPQSQPQPESQYQPQSQPQPESQYQPPSQDQIQSALEKELLSQIPSSSPFSNINPQPASSEDYPVDRSTSISQVRNEMFAQLKKMRSSFQAGQT